MSMVAIAGIIKLIPKEGDLSWISNWRPITMLSITYKIISKFLSNKMKPLIPFLVDEQQASFVPSRNILDNLLAFRLGEDWVKITK